MDPTETRLPPGWAVARIEQIAEVNPRLDLGDQTDGTTVSFVPMAAVEAETGSIDVSRNRPLSEVKKGYRHFRAGDVLFAKITPCMENGKMAVVPPLRDGLGFGSTEFHVLRPHREISPNYLHRFISAAPFRRDAEHHMTGAVGQRRVPTSYLAEQPIPIPPAQEQARIATKIEELFSELDAGIESLQKARTQLATYRQSVLKHAFEGKLTAQWHGVGEALPGGSGLLHKVLLQRQFAWEKSRLREPYARARRVGGRLSFREPAIPCATELPSIPASWCWATVDQLLTEALANGRSVKSAEKGFPVLRLTAFRNGEIEQHECKIGAWTEDDARQFLIREGDILVARGNGSLKLVGIGGLVRSLEAPVAYPDTMIRMRVSRYVDREFLCFVWNSRIVRRQIEARARTTAGIFKVNQQDLQTILIPIPPHEEQTAISAAIRDRFEAIDYALERLGQQVAKAETLRQSILKRAFHGQLGAQNRNDEPASMLLERIRAERERVLIRTIPGKIGRRNRAKVTV